MHGIPIFPVFAKTLITEAVLTSTHILSFEKKKKKKKTENFNFYNLRKICILHGRVFVMHVIME